ncbi:MAG: hypothetical protein AB4050_04705 [Synechococcus sp.]
MSAKAIGAVVTLGVVGVGGYFAYSGLSGVQTNLIVSEVEAIVADLDPQATLDYDSARSGFLSSSAEMTDVVVMLETGDTIRADRIVGNKSGAGEIENIIISSTSGEAISIDRIIVHEVDTENEQPTFARVSVEGLSFEGAAAAFGPQTLVFNSLGYSFDDLTVDLEFAYNFDEAAQQVNASFSQSIAEVGGLSGEMVLGDFSSDDFSMVFESFDADSLSDETATLESLDATLVSVELSYQDDSLIPRVYDFVSAMQQVSVDEVEQMALLFVDQLQTELPDGEFRRQATTAAATFIENPKSLTLTIAPSAPVSFDSVSQDLSANPDLNDIANAYGLSIAANQ